MGLYRSNKAPYSALKADLFDCHFSVGSEVVVAGFHTECVCAYPKPVIPVHIAVGGIEEVIILADLCEAQSQNRIIIIILQIVGRFNETGLDELTVGAKSVVVCEPL